MKIYSFQCTGNHRECDTNEKIISSVRRYLEEKNTPAGDTDIGVRRDEHGKPYIAGLDGIFVSVTHAENLMLVAVAPYDIGIDAEGEGRRVKNPASLARRYFCEDEIAFLGENPTLESFTDMWVKKEALSKLIGRGVPCMKEKSVFSEDLAFKRHTEYPGFVVYSVKYGEKHT